MSERLQQLKQQLSDQTLIDRLAVIHQFFDELQVIDESLICDLIDWYLLLDAHPSEYKTILVRTKDLRSYLNIAIKREELLNKHRKVLS